RLADTARSDEREQARFCERCTDERCLLNAPDEARELERQIVSHTAICRDVVRSGTAALDPSRAEQRCAVRLGQSKGLGQAAHRGRMWRSPPAAFEIRYPALAQTRALSQLLLREGGRGSETLQQLPKAARPVLCHRRPRQSQSNDSDGPCQPGLR